MRTIAKRGIAKDPVLSAKLHWAGVQLYVGMTKDWRGAGWRGGKKKTERFWAEGDSLIPEMVVILFVQ